MVGPIDYDGAEGAREFVAPIAERVAEALQFLVACCRRSKERAYHRSSWCVLRPVHDHYACALKTGPDSESAIDTADVTFEIRGNEGPLRFTS
jgi:hypothetical protein